MTRALTGEPRVAQRLLRCQAPLRIAASCVGDAVSQSGPHVSELGVGPSRFEQLEGDLRVGLDLVASSLASEHALECGDDPSGRYAGSVSGLPRRSTAASAIAAARCGVGCALARSSSSATPDRSAAAARVHAPGRPTRRGCPRAREHGGPRSRGVHPPWPPASCPACRARSCSERLARGDRRRPRPVRRGTGAAPRTTPRSARAALPEPSWASRRRRCREAKGV